MIWFMKTSNFWFLKNLLIKFSKLRAKVRNENYLNQVFSKIINNIEKNFVHIGFFTKMLIMITKTLKSRLRVI